MTTPDRQKIDTKDLLSQVDIVTVIGERLDLAKNGLEYEACCPFHNEKTPSFKVNPAKQFYHCFGCGASGDAIKFLMEYGGLGFVDACRELGAVIPEAGATVAPANASAPASPQKRQGNVSTPEQDKKARTEWEPILPVPDDAPAPPVAHIKRGKPARTWTYRDAEQRILGYVSRFETSDGGKEVLPLTYCRHPVTGAHEWRWISFPEPRPLYGLDRLAARPNAEVLVVEGEKCADAGHAELSEYVLVSWPGGGKAVDKADWAPLSGRTVAGWADCDAKRERLTTEERDAGVMVESKPLLSMEKQPGVMAMRKVAEHVVCHGGSWRDVAIPAPGEKPDGWDIADAIAEGLRGASLVEFVRQSLVENTVAPVPDAASTPPKARAGKVEESPYIPDLVWRKGELASCLSNVYQILLHHPQWRGVVAYDEMSLCAIKRKAPPYEGGRLGEWDAQDDSRTAMWITRNYEFSPSSALVAEAIEVLSRANAWHPVRTYLRSLKWDGVKRLNHWLTRYVGAKDAPYTRRVGAWWLMGAVKRVLQPGVKFDYCLVLSGPQGKGKSTVFQILGGDWFGDTDLNIESKDAMSALRGKLIYEIAELGALARSEEKRQKSFLSRGVDEYRPVYGRREIKAPRQLVFGGSTNDHEWNKDPTGGRRFWPIDCLADVIDHDGLREARDQLFAEALMRVEAGERYWPTAEEQRQLFDPEQLKVEQQDSLVDAMHDWVYARMNEFSAYDAASDCLRLDASKLTRDLQTRIGIALRKLGCTRVERRNGMIRYWYKPPVRNEAESTSGTPAQPAWEGEDVAL
jgi:putative DNA primase/helicase